MKTVRKKKLYNLEKKHQVSFNNNVKLWIWYLSRQDNTTSKPARTKLCLTHQILKTKKQAMGLPFFLDPHRISHLFLVGIRVLSPHKIRVLTWF